MDREPSIILHRRGEEEFVVGEFHYGSASENGVLSPDLGVKLFLTDPPYNLGFDYGPEVDDSKPEEEYHRMMEGVLDSCYEAAADDAHMFMIHYPQDFAKMWPRITKKWRFHQWITWAYPANFGHSSRKWTNASRTLLWLVKGEPEFHGDRVVQPYRNPTDKRIRNLIHEQGQKGTSLYNWWVINLCKNVSKDKRDYSNQIPEELLERVILSTTDPGDIVADPFSGTFSTSRTAMRLGRRAWGCDLNPEVIKWRPTISDYIHEPDIMEQRQVTPFREYPFYEFLEAGMTEEQFNSLASHLIRNAGEDEIAGARGIGEKKAREIRDALDGVERVAKRAGNRSIDDF
jgi:site-specific DNA-methyltransferase (adenine-specific)